MDNLPEFRRQVQRAIDAIPRIHRDLQADAMALGYEELVRRSPVLTGAYRAEHVVTEGDPRSPTALLYEAPNRPGPVKEIPRDGRVLAPPSPGAARRALAGIQPFGIVGALNQRTYAGALEHGHSAQAPNGVYTVVEGLVERRLASARVDPRRLQGGTRG